MTPALELARDTLQSLPWSATDPDSERNRKLRLTYLIRARTARQAKVTKFSADNGYWPLLRWLSEPAPRNAISIDEARAWLRKEVARIGKLKAAGHWAYQDNAHRLPGLRDRLIVATYFSRFGADVWARAAA